MSHKAKYLVIPGSVRSSTDGEIHFISSTELMRLYMVLPKECIIAESRPREYPKHLIKLRPRYDGQYPLFKATQTP